MERIDWISNFIENFLKINEDESKLVTIFLTGEGIYNLIDDRYQIFWDKIFSNMHVICYLDSFEMQVMGIEVDNLLKKYEFNFIFTDKEDKTGFWTAVIYSLNTAVNEPLFGVIQFEGPYMHRNSVYAVNALEAAINNGLKPELYSYLDGVHLGHAVQKPSEFLNIGEKLIMLGESARDKDIDFLMLACARCGKARGYMRDEQPEELYASNDIIPSFFQCNLNKIIDKFEQNHLIIAPSFACIQDNFPKEIGHQTAPPILIFISRPPYSSEWTFGGLSFAMACANHDIMTKVVFIEDGIYSLIGYHHIVDDEKIFNMQELIDGISDLEYLELYAYLPSLEIRNHSISNFLDGIKLIKINELQEIIEHLIKNSHSFHARIMFF